MSKPVNKLVNGPKLVELIALIDEMQADRQPPAIIIRALEKEHGAKHRFANRTYELQIAGVKATCTAGSFGLLTNWKDAARRKIREAGR